MAEQVQPESSVERDSAPPARPPAPPTTGHEYTGGGAAPFRILKAGQGLRVRWGTAIGAGVPAVALADFVWNRLALFDFIERNFTLRTAIPVIVLAAAAYLIFWLVGRQPKVVDFLIATEGEMKKVNWSTRKEVWGATKVVIVTVLALAFILAVVDIVFIAFFSSIGVLKFDLMRQLFGSGNQ